MFIVTTKLSGRKLLCGAAVLAALVLGLRVMASFSHDVAALGTAVADAVQTGVNDDEQVSDKVTTNEERVEYLAACGWQVDADSCVMQDVMIPSDFNETYQAYAEMQEKQGFHIEKYRGKRVKLATYTVENAKEGTKLEANLLIRKNRIIAGDITSLSDGGVAYGLMDSTLRAKSTSKE